MQVVNLLNDKIQSNTLQMELLAKENEKLGKQIASQTKNTIENWVNFEFESSSCLTEEYQAFYLDIKRFLKKELSSDFEIILNRGHFEFYGFVKNKITEKWAYFSCSDVRFFKNEWFENLLIRTATDNKDYTGGSNNYTRLLEIKEALLGLTA